MTEKEPNHLIGENSPYLLQHAYNPVDWYPWGHEALQIAQAQKKLLVISIGYAACHWCHVMEHESFEDAGVAGAMNRDFVSIKVDREERPDIDQIYMAAAYATTGRGGWPLNVIALPDQRPVFAGTYFSKSDWLHILQYFTDLYHTQSEELEHQASEIGHGMKKQHIFPFQADASSMDKDMLHAVYTTWEEDLDFVNGGTYGAPKFPMPGNLGFLLRYGAHHQHKRALEYTWQTLDKMAMGGIYDQLGGGFSRYAVDAFWHVPHFEKMLYDNAQLISVYAQAYTASKKYTYKQIVEESMAFVDRELATPDGLFYASLDADSDGAEGAFYIWSAEEIRRYLGDDSEMFMAYYTCEEKGNWENGRNVLRKSLSDEAFAIKHDISLDQLTALIEVYKYQLFTVRSNRNRPATDDKILTCWNALMISAMTDAARAFNKQVWLDKAMDAAAFYRNNLIRRNGKLWRNSKEGNLKIDGFLDDYCFLIKAFMDIYQSTLDETWITPADDLTREVILHFNAADGIFFNLSSDEGPKLIQETMELSDNVIPASNSQMARNLFMMGHLLENEGYLNRSEEMLRKMIPQIRRNPSFHANWAVLLDDFISGPALVKITGDDFKQRIKDFSGHYLPHVIFSGSNLKTAASVAPVLQTGEKTLFYVCHGKTCYSPVETAHEAIGLIRGLYTSAV
jgi:hypothetical protein